MKRILIVDDEPHIIRLLKLALGRKQYQVDTALNGQLALQKIHEAHPSVLITDIDMPRMSGKDLCSGTELEHRHWTKTFDNLVFLEKPISIRKLIAMLETYFESLVTT
jgi:CheY-like chemotaxis protein